MYGSLPLHYYIFGSVSTLQYGVLSALKHLYVGTLHHINLPLVHFQHYSVMTFLYWNIQWLVHRKFELSRRQILRPYLSHCKQESIPVWCVPPACQSYVRRWSLDISTCTGAFTMKSHASWVMATRGTPSTEQNDRHKWKLYLPATQLSGVKKFVQYSLIATNISHTSIELKIQLRAPVQGGFNNSYLNATVRSSMF